MGSFNHLSSHPFNEWLYNWMDQEMNESVEYQGGYEWDNLKSLNSKIKRELNIKLFHIEFLIILSFV